MDHKGHYLLASVVGLVVLLGSARPVQAELVFFASGRNLSVKGHRTENGSLVLMLRAGGEIVCDPSVVPRIEPDEVPYPEPEPETAPQLDPLPVRLQPDIEAYLQQVSAEQHVPA